MKTIIYAAAVLLVLQIGVTAAVHLRNTSNLESLAPDAPFLSFDPDKITSVEISGPEDKKLVLSKGDKGWIMPDAFAALTGKNQVSDLLDKLAKTKQGLAVATSKEAVARFKTAEDEFERHVVLKQRDKVAAEFYLGTSAGLRRTSHARLAGQDAVVTIPVGSDEIDPEADSWLDRTLADLNRNELKSVALADISLTKQEKKKEKDGEEKTETVWLPEGISADETDKEAVDRLLNKVTGISVQSVLDPEKAAALFKETPAVQFTVTKQDDSTATYAFAKQEDHYVLKMSDSDLYFKVGKWQVEDLTGMKREKLLVSYEEEKDEAAVEQETPAAALPEPEAEQAVLPELPDDEDAAPVQEEQKDEAVVEPVENTASPEQTQVDEGGPAAEEEVVPAAEEADAASTAQDEETAPAIPSGEAAE
ncbi:MAG: DUF4340 domain-containing protein [Candidatus Electrothrix sp. YB6]